MLEVVSPASTGDLTLLATVKAELGITGSDQDAVLTQMIHQASAGIARYCGRTTFARETYRQTEWPARAVPEIILDRDIEVSVDSVTLDDVALAGSDWLLDGSRLRRMMQGRPSCWLACSKIVVEYQAGYELLATLPYDLERACIDLVKGLQGARQRDPALRSERVLDLMEVTYFGSAAAGQAGGLPPDVAARLEPHRLYRFA